MLQFEKGALVRLIDLDGADKGLAVYVDKHPPGSLTASGKHVDTLWHLSVLDADGRMRYLDTYSWTLIPADPDSCNP